MPERDIDTTGPDAPVEMMGDHDLVASDRVEGTHVYGLDHQKIGHVHNFMVNKRTGQVAHLSSRTVASSVWARRATCSCPGKT